MDFIKRMKNILLLLACFAKFGVAAASSMGEIHEKPLVVLVTSYNNEKWLVNNLHSIFNQKYTNYRVVYVDDCSNDKTADNVENEVKKLGQGHRFTLIRNPNRIGALANIYYAVYDCKDEEIIVSLDGDDWFQHEKVLRKVNEAYASPDVWLTHGSMVEFPKKGKSWCIPVPEKIIKNNAFRTYRCPSHLRTFYAWLFKKITLEDLLYEGDFFPMTWDQAIMFPMIEMAGERHAFISEILYVYNMSNVLNDNKVNAQLQRDLETYIRRMPVYDRLTTAPY